MTMGLCVSERESIPLYNLLHIQSSFQPQDEKEAASQEWFFHDPDLIYLHFHIYDIISHQNIIEIGHVNKTTTIYKFCFQQKHQTFP